MCVCVCVSSSHHLVEYLVAILGLWRSATEMNSSLPGDGPQSGEVKGLLQDFKGTPTTGCIDMGGPALEKVTWRHIILSGCKENKCHA